jgi:hypothetical protein
MSVLNDVKELVNAISPQCICDDCITQKLGLTVRQHANQKTRQLAGYAGIVRVRRVCDFCGAKKLSISATNSPIKGKKSFQSRLSHKSTGAFDPQKWVAEGDGLLASSRKVRDTWDDHRAAFSETVKQKNSGQRPTSNDWALLTGLPRTSMLLLGYAVEMYLKAGIAKAYQGCASKMFERDVKSRFGHKQDKMAKELAFPRETNDQQHFQKLTNMVLVDARYPIFVPEGDAHAEAVNQQTSRIWSKNEYDNLYELARRVRKHVSRIDADSENPALFDSFNIDDDGYLAFRGGGNLPPRITYCLSAEMRDADHKAASDVKSLLDERIHHLILRFWDQAWIYEDGKNDKGQPKTLERQQPSTT